MINLHELMTDIRGLRREVESLRTQMRRPPSISQHITLFKNGFGNYGDNANFSGFSVNTIERVVGRLSFFIQQDTVQITSDGGVEVDPYATYDLSVWTKADPYVGAKHYVGLAQYDEDGQTISPYYIAYSAGSETTLAADLKPGDTTITLTSSANWHNGSTASLRGVALYPYTSALGRVYDDYTYTRHALNAAYSAGGISGNVVTLDAPWSISNPDHGSGWWLSGSSIANANSGSSYMYCLAVNAVIPSAWTRLTGTVAGIQTAGVLSETKFRNGTKYVRPIFLTNRDVSGGGAFYNGIRMIPAGV